MTVLLTAGDLLGDNTAASPATAADTGGMFAGLDVGSSNTQAAALQASLLLSGLDVAPGTPQSPMDALAGLQGPSHAPPNTGLCQLMPVACTCVMQMSKEGCSGVVNNKAEACYALYAMFIFLATPCTVLHCDCHLHKGG